MHPSPSIIFFTTLSGAGYGLLVLLGLAAAQGVLPGGPSLGFASLGGALGLITLGLLASTLHLGHPERAWRGISQVRSSWLSREGVAALVTYVPALAFAFGWLFLGRTDGPFAVAGLLAALCALVTVYCTAMIYASLKPIRQWSQPLVPWIYLTLALMSGALIGHALFALFGVERRWLGVIALLSSALALGLKIAYWHVIDRLPRPLTPADATGLGPGPVPQLDPPHTQTNYLLDEMGFRIGRRHARRLRVLALGLWAGGGLLLTGLALALSGWPAVASALLAAASGLLAVVIERWLFFAEASHTMALYYGRTAA